MLVEIMGSKEEQRRFLGRVKDASWLSLLENIPDVCFFMKDAKGRYMGANRAYSDYMGVASTSELLGKRDDDFHPGDLSQAYVADDLEVMRTGKSIVDLVEPWSNRDGRFGWTVTSKHPVYDIDGDAIGVMGFTRPSENAPVPEAAGLGGAATGGDPGMKLQAEFLEKTNNPQGTHALFEHLPGVLFFIKDRERRFVAANRLLLDRLGLSSEREIVGTCDSDYFPPEVCAGFEKDDRRLLESGGPIIGRMEQSYNERRLLVWYVTTKLPVYDTEGRVIGLMGVNRISDDPDGYAPASATSLSKATELVRQNPDRRVSTEEMAAAAGMSVWQLRRRFRKAFGMTPHDFERTSRIQGACHALAESDDSIAEIALNHGFCDQSAFSVQFRKQMGRTPKEYRNDRESWPGS